MPAPASATPQKPTPEQQQVRKNRHGQYINIAEGIFKNMAQKLLPTDEFQKLPLEGKNLALAKAARDSFHASRVFMEEAFGSKVNLVKPL